MSHSIRQFRQRQKGRLRDKTPMEHFTIKREMAIVCMQPLFSFGELCGLADEVCAVHLNADPSLLMLMLMLVS